MIPLLEMPDLLAFLDMAKADGKLCIDLVVCQGDKCLRLARICPGQKQVASCGGCGGKGCQPGQGQPLQPNGDIPVGPPIQYHG